MTITRVRVERSYKQTVTDFIVVEVVTDASHAWNARRLAEQLVEAQMAAGQDIDWQQASCVVQDYPAAIISAELVHENDGPALDEVPAPPSRAAQNGDA